MPQSRRPFRFAPEIAQHPLVRYEIGSHDLHDHWREEPVIDGLIRLEVRSATQRRLEHAVRDDFVTVSEAPGGRFFALLRGGHGSGQ